MTVSFIIFTKGFQSRFASTQAPLPVTNANLHYGTVDGYFEKVKLQKDFGEPNNRDFAYFMVGGARMAYASVARLCLIRVSWAIEFHSECILRIYFST